MCLAASLTRARGWLERNKVFFEVFSWIGLGVMAILVSYASLQVSQLQARIRAAQVSPQIRVSTALSYDTQRARNTDLIVNIFNDGFPLSDYESTVRSLYELTRIEGNRKSVAYHPIGYLCCHFLQGTSQGLLAEYRQPDNNEHAFRIEREVRRLNEGQSRVRFDLQLVTIVVISFRDSLGIQRREGFHIRPVFGGRRIGQPEVDEWFRRYQESEMLLKEIDSFNGELLVRAFNDACRLSTGCS